MSIPTTSSEQPSADDVADWATSFGLTFTLAWLIQEANDEDYGGYTPEQRYEKMLGWTRRHIRPTDAARPEAPGEGV